MNPTLKEALELADKKNKKKLANNKHKFESYTEKNYFVKILYWMRQKNET